jgi:hypothetical protein
MVFDFLRPKKVAASLIAKRLIEHYGSLSDKGLLSKAKHELERIERRDRELHKYVLKELCSYGIKLE